MIFNFGTPVIDSDRWKTSSQHAPAQKSFLSLDISLHCPGSMNIKIIKGGLTAFLEANKGIANLRENNIIIWIWEK